MELKINHQKQYYNTRRNASFVRKELDTRFFPNEYGKYYYEKHLEEAIEHPTISMIAMNEAKKSPLLDFPYHFERNKKIIEEKSGTVKTLKNSLDDIIDFLYPKTKKIRAYIIDNSRIEFDNIKKSKGYNFIDKLKIFLK